ncbi:MAG: hypothetical protein ABIG61_00995 [Planctomycetota bacterium]
MMEKMIKNIIVLMVLVLTAPSFAAEPTYQQIPADPLQILASGIADASGSGGEMYVEYWVWDGGDGYYYYTYSITNTGFTPYIQYLTIANPSREPYYITGRSGGWNPQTGVQGQPWIGSSPINQISIVQWSSNDPFSSNIYPGYNSWTAEEGQLFQFASALPPTSAGFTVMQGDTSITASGLIAAPGDATTTPRSSGYWKHQSGTKGMRKEATSIPGYLAVIGATSNVFESLTLTSCNNILSVDNNSDMRQKAEKELLALWLNVVSCKMNYTAEISFADSRGISIAMKLQQVIADVESTILNPAATIEELEYQKDTAEILNNL